MRDDFQSKLGQVPDFVGRLRRLEQAHIGYYRAAGEGQQSHASPFAPLSADIELKIAKHMENTVVQAIDRVEHTMRQVEILKQLADLRAAPDEKALASDIQFTLGTAAITLGWVDTHCDNPSVASYLSKDFKEEAFPRKEALGQAIIQHAQAPASDAHNNVTPIDKAERMDALLQDLQDNRADLNFMAGMQADVKMVFAEQLMKALGDDALSPDSHAFTQIFDMSPLHYLAASIPAISGQLLTVGREHAVIAQAANDTYHPLRMPLKPLDLQF